MSRQPPQIDEPPIDEGDLKAPRTWSNPKVQDRLRRRHSAEKRFRLYGRLAVFLTVSALAWLLLSIAGNGYSAFTAHWVTLDVNLDAQIIDPESRREASALREADFRQILIAALGADLAGVEGRRAQIEAVNLLSSTEAASILRRKVIDDPSLIGTQISLPVPTSDLVDQVMKGRIDRSANPRRRPITDQQLRWLDEWIATDRIERRFNHLLFTRPDSRDPARAGIASALIGSAFMLILAALLSLPIGIGTAIYLDEFAPRTGFGGRLSRALEIIINNLAAIPSIVFGLLGLAVFINFFGLARSIPLVGGMVLALRMFPTLIIASRAALQSVPPSIVNSALSLGATRSQAVFGQKLPLATPGVLTGAILALAQALGETAPLLMIGMVAFVTEVPSTVTDPATALPVQIFIWSDSPERAWSERTSAAIMILLLFLLVINGLAIWLRGRLQKRMRL